MLMTVCRLCICPTRWFQMSTTSSRTEEWWALNTMKSECQCSWYHHWVPQERTVNVIYERQIFLHELLVSHRSEWELTDAYKQRVPQRLSVNYFCIGIKHCEEWMLLFLHGCWIPGKYIVNLLCVGLEAGEELSLLLLTAQSRADSQPKRSNIFTQSGRSWWRRSLHANSTVFVVFCSSKSQQNCQFFSVFRISVPR